MQIIDPQPARTAYAGFTSRFFAYLVDMLIIGFVRSVFALIFGFSVFHPSVDIIWFGSISGLLYFILMEGSKYQATIGKMVLRIQVVDQQGMRISNKQAIVRNIAKILSAVIILIGFLMVIFDERKRGLHDMIAGTFVVEE